MPPTLPQPASGRPWLHAVRRALHPGHWGGHECIIVSCRAGLAARVEGRLRALLDGRHSPRGEPIRAIVIEERAHHPGNLGGTLLVWRAACERAAAHGEDLSGRWRRGELRVLIVHAAGLGRRAEPLTSAEGGDRSAILLPGTLGGTVPTLLTACVAQAAPLARTQPPGFLDVLWCSQLFVPTVDPDQLPSPHAPLTKLVSLDPVVPPGTSALPDLGLFDLDSAGRPTRFTPQGAALPASDARRAVDLGSSRLRADLLDGLSQWWRDAPNSAPLDLDPHLTGPLLGGAPTPAALAARASLPGEPLVDVCALGSQIPWWRLRRPSEIRAAAISLRPRDPTGAPLRHLLGIRHPVERSWIGDRWIEGPELSWARVADGAVIEGIHIEDSVIHDSAIAAGSRVRSSVASWWCGRVTAARSWLVAGGGAHVTAEHSLVWRRTPSDPITFVHATTTEATGSEGGGAWPPIGDPVEGVDAADHLDAMRPDAVHALPEAVRARLRHDLRVGSIVRLLDRDPFRVAVHAGLRAPSPDTSLILGRVWRGDHYRLHLDAATWCRWQGAPGPFRDALVFLLTTHFLAPTGPLRDALAHARRDALRRGPLPLDPIPPERALDALAQRTLATDSDERTLHAALSALDAASPADRSPTSPERALAWLRWRLERGDTAGPLSEALAQLPAPVREAIALPGVTAGLPGDLPQCDLRPAPAPDAYLDADAISCQLADRLHARYRAAGHASLGLYGPAAAGKSTLAEAVLAQLEQRGLPTLALPTDSRTWHGDGFRYTQHAHDRDVTLYGPAIYDDARIARDLRRAREGGQIVVADGVFLGSDARVDHLLDLRVAVILQDRQRLIAKRARDQAPDGRRIDVETDFFHKILHESREGILPLIRTGDGVWDRGDGAWWQTERSRSSQA